VLFGGKNVISLKVSVLGVMAKGSPFLSQLQCRILSSMYLSKIEYLNSETILKQTGIAQSTWSEEQNRLTEMGLLEKKQSRIMTSNIITRVMNYKLTDKGKLVALNLSNISRILAPDQFSLDSNELRGLRALSKQGPNNEIDLDAKILECIEIGLDSFGMNLDKLVRSEIEKSDKVEWTQIAKFPDKLEFHLRELFGVGGSSTIESMIAANIRSRFGLRSIRSNSIPALIAEIRLSSRKSGTGFSEKSTLSMIE
jgi:DNA-binding MarR family transcriptional regulator